MLRSQSEGQNVVNLKDSNQKAAMYQSAVIQQSCHFFT